MVTDYRFYLNFKNVGSFGRIEITEPIGFDGTSFIIEQDTKRYGRDAYKINEGVNLSFYKGTFESNSNEYLTQGFEQLLSVYNDFGFEADVDFEIELNGTTFIPANLDFQTSETDGFTYFSCKALQDSSKQLLKRRTDLVVDVFSDKDIDGNAITPLVAENILLKAKPVVQVSEWEYTPFLFNEINNQGLQEQIFFPIFNLSRSYGVESSLVSFDLFTKGSVNSNPNLIKDAYSNATKIKAKNNLSNIKIKIKNLSFTSACSSLLSNLKRLSVVYGSNYELDNYEIIDLEFTGTTTDVNFSVSNKDYEVEIPFVPLDGFIAIVYRMIDFFPSAGGSVGFFAFNVTSGSLEITATATAIDTVIKGVRWVDVIKQNIKSLNGFDTVAPQLDVGGEHYNNFAFTGNLIKRRDDVAFPVKFKDLMEMLQEHNGDFQILNDKVYINTYENFYPDNEIGVLTTAPDDSFKTMFNERFAINQFELSYKNFEDDKDESNTIDTVHTNTQWSLDNVQVENTKKIELDQIRDPFKIEFSRREAVKKTTATNDDDSLFLIDVVQLSPTAQGGFTSTMTHNATSDGNLQLLKDADLPSWGVLGFEVNSLFYIDSSENNGNYKVLEIQDSILLIERIGAPPTLSGAYLTTVRYYFINVLYTNRTDENFDLIENIVEPSNFANLKYTPKRNIKHWESYLATASKFKPNSSFRNRYFKNNGNLVTRLDTEVVNTVEKQDVLNSDLPSPILTPILFESRLVAPFETMVSIINAMNTINLDGSIGGYIRVIDNNGNELKLFPQKLEYMPSTETLTMIGEQLSV